MSLLLHWTWFSLFCSSSFSSLSPLPPPRTHCPPLLPFLHHWISPSSTSWISSSFVSPQHIPPATHKPLGPLIAYPKNPYSHRLSLRHCPSFSFSCSSSTQHQNS